MSRRSAARSLRGVVLGVTCAFAGSIACEPPAQADTPPSVWDRARDPDGQYAFRVHQAAMFTLMNIELARHENRTDLVEAEALRLRRMLEHNGAETSKDVRLRIDLAAAYHELKQHPRAIQILREVLGKAPLRDGIPAVRVTDNDAERAWRYLSFACGHTGDHVCERESYEVLLRRTTEDIDRIVPTLNLAETEMHLGDLKAAIDGYRETLRLASHYPSLDSATLAEWGLAVALDRSGDRVSAEKEARFALELERSKGGASTVHSEAVFFFPQYEIHWYDGLGAMAAARAAKKPSDAAELFGKAEREFAAYVKGAEPAKDRWLAVAKARLESARTERIAAERRRGKEPAAPLPREREEEINL